LAYETGPLTASQPAGKPGMVGDGIRRPLLVTGSAASTASGS